MKLVFVYWGYENAGSMLDLRGYARAARGMGHQVTIYGPPNAGFALDYSQELAGADAVVAATGAAATGTAAATLTGAALTICGGAGGGAHARFQRLGRAGGRRTRARA